MRLREVFLWLIIFIVGSLIVTFLISPNSFSSFINNIQSLKPTANIVKNTEEPSPETIRIKAGVSPYLEDAYKNLGSEIPAPLSCSILELGAESQGIPRNKVLSLTCTNSCGEWKKEYYSYECVTDKLYCYCLK